MRLRAPKARLSSLGGCSVTNELVRAMTYRMYAALIASLSVVALMLAANETFARSGGAPRAAFASTHSMFRPSVALRHHRRNNGGTFFPAVGGDFFYGPSTGEPLANATQPVSGGIHATCTYDIPWDWVHRCPPNVAPSERAYAPSCTAETATVPGHDGTERTVNITRCY
jgi:hypothetical protein